MAGPRGRAARDGIRPEQCEAPWLEAPWKGFCPRSCCFCSAFTENIEIE